MLAAANASIAIGGGRIDQTIINHQFNCDIWIGSDEAINQRGKDIDHHSARDVELEAPPHVVLGTDGIVERHTGFGQ